MAESVSLAKPSGCGSVGTELHTKAQEGPSRCVTRYSRNNGIGYAEKTAAWRLIGFTNTATNEADGWVHSSWVAWSRRFP